MNSIIMGALSSIGVPVSFQKYSGNANQYITFFIYGEQGELWSDNTEKTTGYYIQVDIWSKSDYTSLVNSVITAMKTAGFARTYAMDMYEDDTQIYHKSIRFNINKEV